MGYYGAFENCTSLISAPEIPNSVTNMDAAFFGCTSLTNATTIPSSVTRMNSTFSGCESLAGTIEINATSIDAYLNCFSGTVKPILLTGSCNRLDKLANTAKNGNVTVQVDSNVSE